jgi:hypothetical protein
VAAPPKASSSTALEHQLVAHDGVVALAGALNRHIFCHHTVRRK